MEFFITEKIIATTGPKDESNNSARPPISKDKEAHIMADINNTRHNIPPKVEHLL